MRPIGDAKTLERRRIQAVRYVMRGKHSTAQAAKKFNVSIRMIQLWVLQYRRRGLRGIKARKTPGRPSRMSIGQKKRLERILLNGAQKAGFSTDLWTCPRIARVIENEFGITYHVDHIVRFLGLLGWSVQKPQRRAIERDEDKIAQWKKYRWVQIKKKPESKGQHSHS